jgi:hypothetical protein
MGKKKKEIKIIKKDTNNEDYTFVSSDDILNNTKDNESTNNENKPQNNPDERIEKKIHSKKVDNKGRKILGKSLQGHSPYMNNMDYRIISF